MGDSGGGSPGVVELEGWRVFCCWLGAGCAAVTVDGCGAAGGGEHGAGDAGGDGAWPESAAVGWGPLVAWWGRADPLGLVSFWGRLG